jgi:hypothetical protein
MSIISLGSSDSEEDLLGLSLYAPEISLRRLSLRGFSYSSMIIGPQCGISIKWYYIMKISLQSMM